MRRAADGVKQSAEQDFLPAVLAAAHRRLHARLGAAAVVRVDHLDLRLRLGSDDLASTEAAESFGEDLADAIVARALRIGSVLPSAALVNSGSRVYEDTVAFVATRLLAVVAGMPGPEGVETLSEVWPEATALSDAGLAEMLVRIEVAGRLTQVLRALSPSERTVLSHRIAAVLPRHVAAKVRSATVARRTAPRPGRPEPNGPAPTLRSGPPSALVAAKDVAETGSGPRAIVAKTPRQLHNALKPTAIDRLHLVGQDIAAPLPSTGPDVAMPDGALHGLHLSPHADLPTQAQAPPVPATAQVARPTVDKEGALDPEFPAVIDLESRWCPLLGLLVLTLKLELPEKLWQVGVDEGAALAAMFGRLCGDPEDPAIKALSAAFPDAAAPMDRLPVWAREELLSGGLDAAEALCGDQVAPRIAALTAWFGDGDGSWDLAAWGAALHLVVAEHALGRSIAPGEVARQFAGLGRIVVDSAVICVVQPMAAIDIDLRRAGLDANSGWLPWLQKRLEFRFVDPEDP